MSATLSSSPRSPIKNQDGQSLIQLLVSIGIMGILISGFASMQVSQQRQISQVSQKMASLDLQRVVTAALANANVCNYMVAPSGTPAFGPFDPSTLGTTSAPPFAFTQIPSAVIASAPGPAAVSASMTTPASPLSNSLFVKSISLTNFKCPDATNPPCSAASVSTTSPNQFSANLTVAFDSSKLIIGLAPLSFPVTITTNGATSSSQAITGCQGGGGTTCTAGTVGQADFDVPGNFYFIVPCYNSLTVQLWGAGSGGTGFGYFGDSVGGLSSFNKLLIAGGGNSGLIDYDTGNWIVAPAAGTASGGDTNVSGAIGANGQTHPCCTGANLVGGAGAAAPNGGGTGGTGGSGLVVNATPGQAPGGGGGGASWVGFGSSGAGGESGGYVSKTYSAGDLTPGSYIQITTGAGGVGLPKNSSNSASGAGGKGLVQITWH